MTNVFLAAVFSVAFGIAVYFAYALDSKTKASTWTILAVLITVIAIIVNLVYAFADDRRGWIALVLSVILVVSVGGFCVALGKATDTKIKSQATSRKKKST